VRATSDARSSRARSESGASWVLLYEAIVGTLVQDAALEEPLTVLPLDEAGDGPALVLLHAGIADRTMWTDHLVPLGEAGFRAVAPDMPGFGSAPVAKHENAPWNDVLRTMDALSVERAAMVGCSFGGAIALCVALTAPERVSALVLCSAPSDDIKPSAELEAAWAAEEAAMEAGDTNAAVAAVVDPGRCPTPRGVARTRCVDATPRLRPAGCSPRTAGCRGRPE
jgi:pimeloyl-ACP methyl ester carboxylesterase